jgi:large subunit ribosomal protein L10
MAQNYKIERVDELADMLKGAKSVILNDYKGLDVADISELRRKCRENNVTFRVIKNTLAKRAFEKIGAAEMGQFLTGPTAVALSYQEEVLPAQILKKFSEEYELPRFKGALVNGRVMNEEQTTRFASLPSKEELRAQVVGTFAAPVRGLVICLDASRRNLVYVLNAISEKQGAA